MKHSLTQYLTQQNDMLSNKLKSLNDQFNKEKAALEQLERQTSAGHVSNTGPRSMLHNMSSALNPYEMPGNVGDINRIVWPFWFNSDDIILGPNQGGQSNISITQEAGFILLYYTASVFQEIAPGEYAYVDPEAVGSAGKANNLNFEFMDSSSSRRFMNRPMAISSVGYWKQPTTLPQPLFFLPNSNIQINYSNDDQFTVYRPRISFFGYRFRLDNAKDVLSLVYG